MWTWTSTFSPPRPTCRTRSGKSTQALWLVTATSMGYSSDGTPSLPKGTYFTPSRQSRSIVCGFSATVVWIAAAGGEPVADGGPAAGGVEAHDANVIVRRLTRSDGTESDLTSRPVHKILEFYHPSHRRNASTTFNPPKAKELERALRISARRASLGTTSRSHSGSGVVNSIVGGSRPSLKASTVATHSRAPAAPSVWPCIDLVELTASLSVWAPKTCQMARASMGSFARVPVPWALM